MTTETEPYRGLTLAEETGLRDRLAKGKQTDMDAGVALASIDAERRITDTLGRVVSRLLTRSPLDSRGACFYCNLFAGQLEVRGQLQLVPRHTDDCVIAVALSMFREGPG